MNKATWKQGRDKSWFGDYRGLSVRISVDPTGRPETIAWFIDGNLVESSPVQCAVAIAKEIATRVIDEQIARGNWAWASARSEKIRKYARR